MTTTLIAKIAAASLKVGALKTDKTNTQQNYAYISADKVLERAGDALAAAGVVIIPSIIHEEMERVDTGNNKSRYDSTVHFVMTLSDGTSSLEMPWRGRGSDYTVPDKALYKAITSGHKYFLTKLLNIGVGNEDGEHETVTPFDEPAPERISPDQLKRLNILGKDYYGDEWNEMRPKLVIAVTTGVSDSSKELSPKEADKLICGIEKRLKERAAAPIAE